MKRFFGKYFPVIPVGLVLGTILFSHSCANTTTPPSGGPKDTIPPVIVELFPYPGATHVPAHKTQLEFKFNEFVTVKDQQSIFLSPPMEKRPIMRAALPTIPIRTNMPLYRFLEEMGGFAGAAVSGIDHDTSYSGLWERRAEAPDCADLFLAERQRADAPDFTAAPLTGRKGTDVVLCVE